MEAPFFVVSQTEWVSDERLKLILQVDSGITIRLEWSDDFEVLDLLVEKVVDRSLACPFLVLHVRKKEAAAFYHEKARFSILIGFSFSFVVETRRV